MDPSLNRRMPAEFVDDDLRVPAGWHIAKCCDAWLAEDHQDGTVLMIFGMACQSSRW